VNQHTAPAERFKDISKRHPGVNLQTEIVHRPYSHLIEKHLPGSFTERFGRLFRKQKIDTVVISGIDSNVRDTTARQSLHLGIPVEFCQTQQ
jgi:hypothetical protein